MPIIQNLLVVLLIIAFGLGIWIAVKVAHSVQKAIDEEKRGGRKADSKYAWLGHIHGLWGMLGAAAGAWKFIFKEWKTAPVGSWEKLGWGCLMGGIIVLALCIIVKMVDRKLNPPVRYGEDAPSLALAASQPGATEGTK